MAMARQTLGRPVVQQGSGSLLGRVRDVLLDEGGRQVVALQLGAGSWFGPPRVIAWRQVVAVDSDRIVVAGEAVEPAALGQAALSLQQLAGRTPYGAVAAASLDDVVFDPSSGQVLGYRVSGGVLQDLLEGRHFIDAGQLTLETGEGGQLDGGAGPDLT